MPSPNPLSNRFGGSNDLPPGAPDYTRGPLANPAPTPAATPITTPAPQSLADRAKASMQKALDGMSALLGRTVTGPAAAPDRTTQLEGGLNALQARSSPPTPNILATIPRLAPLVSQPTPPVGTPKPAPTPFSLDGWMMAQNSKGS